MSPSTNNPNMVKGASAREQAAGDDAQAAISHDEAGRRFSLTADGHEGYVDYALDAGTMVIIHTVVPPAIGGRGIAGRLVRAAFEHARSQGWRVRTDCSYAAGWVRKHPEFADLLA